MAVESLQDVPETLPIVGSEPNSDPSLIERTQQLCWDAARLAVKPFTHHNLSSPPLDYRPVRHAVLEPDTTYVVEASSGDYPVYVFNEDALGDRSEQADIVMHMSLAVRADQGIVSPTASHLTSLAREQGRGLILIGAPGSAGHALTPKEFFRLSLPAILRDSHEVLDETADVEGVELQRAVHLGASLGGYLSLSFANSEIAALRDEQGKQPHEVVTAIPIAPAGWKLRPLQRIAAGYQFLVLEPSHVIDKAAQMSKDERDEYIRSFTETIPHVSALPGIGKLALDFLCRGDLAENINQLPRDLRIRGIAFDGDEVTIPYLLLKHLTTRDFEDATVKIIDGRHLSLASFRKVMHDVVEPALAEDLAA